MNGFVVGSWAPKIPEFMARFELSESRMGMAILALGLGSLAAMPIAGVIITKHGTANLLRGLAVATASTLLLVTLSPIITSAIAAVILLGATIGAMDVVMNANAVSVERKLGRAIMSSCHGFWSLGGLAGAALGGYLIAWIGLTAHAVIVTGLAMSLVVMSWKFILDDGAKIPGEKRRFTLPQSPLPWLMGIIAFFSIIPEGAVLDWSALFLRDERGVSVSLSGLGFGSVSIAMAVMRFLGDGLRNRFGAVRVMFLGSAFAALGLSIAAWSSSPWIIFLGFAIAGAGLSNLVPIAFSAAGNLPGLPPGVGITIATFMGYSGLLLAPFVIGFIAEHTGFSLVFACLPGLLAVVLLLSPLARYADRDAN